jgi:hypothetical protein
MTEHEKTLRAIYAMLNQPVQFTPNTTPTVQILRGDCAAVRRLIERTLDADAALDRGALEHAAWYDTSAELA